MFRSLQQYRYEWALALLIALAVPFFMAHLGYLPLWEDEAHTAIIARAILRLGIPFLWDGTNLVSGVSGDDVGPALLLTWDGPLQFYLAALFFRLFGEGELIARLPFVLFGIGSLPLTYLLAHRVSGSRKVALLSVLLLCTCTPFILHIRHARYYSLSIFFGTLLLFGYYSLSVIPTKVGIHNVLDSGFRRNDRGGIRALVWFVAGGIGLFYSNPFSLVVVWGACAVHLLLTRREALRQFAIGSIAIAIPAIPWFIFAQLYAKHGPSRLPGLIRFVYLAFELIYKFNKFLFPIVLWIPLYVLWHRRRCHGNFILLSILLYLLGMLGIAKLLPAAVRYAIWFLPVAAILSAILVKAAWNKNRAMGAALVAVFLFSNVFIQIPTVAVRLPLYMTMRDFTPHRREKLTTHLPQAIRKTFGRFQFNTHWYFTSGWWLKSLWKMDLAAYWHEVTHEYRDPINGVMAFFRERARPGDEALMAVDSFAAMYYLPWLKQAWMVRPKMANWWRWHTLPIPEYIRSFDTIRWFVPRDIKRMKGPAISAVNFVRLAHQRSIRFVRHELADYSYYWDGSRPETLAKYVRQHSDLPLPQGQTDKVVIYEIIGRGVGLQVSHPAIVGN